MAAGAPVAPRRDSRDETGATTSRCPYRHHGTGAPVRATGRDRFSSIGAQPRRRPPQRPGALAWVRTVWQWPPSRSMGPCEDFGADRSGCLPFRLDVVSRRRTGFLTRPLHGRVGKPVLRPPTVPKWILPQPLQNRHGPPTVAHIRGIRLPVPMACPFRISAAFPRSVRKPSSGFSSGSSACERRKRHCTPAKT